MASVLCRNKRLTSNLCGLRLLREMRTAFLFLLVTLVACAGASSAQSSSTASGDRKVTARVSPAYPELARKMRLQGVVKIEAVVKPNGTVKSTRVLGGNPVLVDAATDAVSKWKFESGPSETTEIVQLTFTPQQ
jgi:TonB family protein